MRYFVIVRLEYMAYSANIRPAFLMETFHCYTIKTSKKNLREFLISLKKVYILKLYLHTKSLNKK